MNPRIVRVLATDIDGTLVGYGGEESLALFLRRHQEIGVIYLTGRTRNTAQELVRRYRFPVPLALSTDVGADIYWGPDLRLDDTWAFRMRQDWSPRRVRSVLSEVPGVTFAGRNSHWRLTFRLDDESLVPMAKKQLIQAGVPARTFYDERDHRLDVLPRGALKGRALQRVLSRLGIPAQNCFVAGDAENDGDMFQGRYRGVLVSNGSPLVSERLSDRIMRSELPGASGVLDGLKRWLHEGDAAHGIHTPEYVS